MLAQMALCQVLFWLAWQFLFGRTQQALELSLATLAVAGAACLIPNFWMARAEESISKFPRSAMLCLAGLSCCHLYIFLSSPRTLGDAADLLSASLYCWSHGFLSYLEHYQDFNWLACLHPPLIPALASPAVGLAGGELVSSCWFFWLVAMLIMALTYRLGSELGGSRLGLLTALSLACMRYFWTYVMLPGNDAAVMLFGLAAQLFCFRLRSRPGNHWATLGLAFSLALGLYSKYTAVLMFPAVMFWGYSYPRMRWPLGMAISLATVLFLPWAVLALPVQWHNLAMHLPVRPDNSGQVVFVFRPYSRLARYGGIFLSQGACLLPLLALAWRRHGRQLLEPPLWAWLGAYALLGAILPLSRYLIPAMPVVALGVAKSLQHSPPGYALRCTLLALSCGLLFAYQHPEIPYLPLTGEPSPRTFHSERPILAPNVIPSAQLRSGDPRGGPPQPHQGTGALTQTPGQSQNH